MQKKSIWVIAFSLMVVVLSSTLLLSQAQDIGSDDQGMPNDPRVNDRANACYDDPRFLDQCDTPIEWHCGYTVIRYDYALIDREAVIAGGCEAYLPPDLSNVSTAISAEEDTANPIIRYAFRSLGD